MSEESKPNGKINNELGSSAVSATTTTSASLTRSAVQHESSGDAPTRPFDAYVLGTIGPLAQLYFNNVITFAGDGHLQYLINTLAFIADLYKAPETALPMSIPDGLDALAALLHSHGLYPREITYTMDSDGIPMYLVSYLDFISDVAYWGPADLQARYEACLSSSSDAGSTHYEGVVMAGSPARVVDESACEREHPSSKNNEEGVCDGRYLDATTPTSLERFTIQHESSGDATSFREHVLSTIGTREGFDSFERLSLCDLICALREQFYLIRLRPHGESPDRLGGVHETATVCSSMHPNVGTPPQLVTAPEETPQGDEDPCQADAASDTGDASEDVNGARDDRHSEYGMRQDTPSLDVCTAPPICSSVGRLLQPVTASDMTPLGSVSSCRLDNEISAGDANEGGDHEPCYEHGEHPSMSPIGMGVTSSTCSRAGMPLPPVTILNITSFGDLNSRRLSNEIGSVEANNEELGDACCEHEERPGASPLSMDVTPSTRSSAGTPLRPVTIPDMTSLGDMHSRCLSNEIGADEANCEGFDDECYEHAVRPDASPLGVDMTPSTCSSAGMPLRPVAVSDMTSLGGMNSRCMGNEVGNVEANGEKLDDECCAHEKRSDTSPLGMGVVPLTYSNVGMPLPPVAVSDMTSLGATNSRRLGNEVGNVGTNGEGFDGEHFEYARRPTRAQLGLDAMPSASSHAGMPPRPVAISDVTSLGAESRRPTFNEAGTHDADGKRHGDEYYKYAGQPRASQLSLGTMPPIDSHDGQPPRAVPALAKVPLGDGESHRVDNEADTGDADGEGHDGEYYEYAGRPRASQLGLSTLPPIASRAGQPPRPAPVLAKAPLGDGESHRVDNEAGAHDADGEGHVSEYCEYAERPRASKLGLSTMPPLGSRAGQPPRSAPALAEAPLSDGVSRRVSNEVGTGEATDEEHSDELSGFMGRPHVSPRGLDTLPPSCSSALAPLRPAITPDKAFLSNKNSRQLDDEVGTGDANGGEDDATGIRRFTHAGRPLASSRPRASHARYCPP